MILDTCALLWLGRGDFDRFSAETRELLDVADTVYVTAITGFEIGLKYAAGKLSLPVPPFTWLRRTLVLLGIEVIDLDLDLCVRATQLPAIHKDPCDRMIIAAALKHDLPVVTADANFAKYGVQVLF